MSSQVIPNRCYFADIHSLEASGEQPPVPAPAPALAQYEPWLNFAIEPWLNFAIEPWLSFAIPWGRAIGCA